MRRDLLFVTFMNEHYEEGLSYAIDLARTLGNGLSVLLVREKRKNLAEKFSDIMSAAAFAEAGEHDAARELILSRELDLMKEITATFETKCGAAGVKLNLTTSELDAVQAVKAYIKDHPPVDMVLLSPPATQDGSVSAKELNTLVKTAGRPVVTINRQVCVA
jgi:hypothetical protein